jgi:flagellar M-ring protein FliF
MTAKRVTVSVGVPNSYYEMVWRKQNNITDLEQAPATNAIIAIESAVKTAIAEEIAAMLPVHGKDPVKQVTVKSFTDPPKIEVAEPGFGENAAAWFGQYWSTLGMTMLGLVSLLMLRSMVRSSPISTGANEQTPATAAEALRQDDDGIDEESVAGTKPARRLQRRGTDGPSLRDELSEMVREDPDAAAGVLRAWIGTGA